MKILWKKIKNANRFALAIYLLSNILYFIGYVLFAKCLLNLVGIETFIRVLFLIVSLLWLMVYFLFGLSTMLVRKYKKFIVLTIIQLILFIAMLFVSIFINKIYSKLEMISSQEYTLYTTNLIALNKTELTNTSKLGMIDNNEDIEGYVLANSLKAKENLKQNVTYYDDYYSMLIALYKGEVDAIFVSSNYAIIFSSEESYENIAQETKVLFTYSEEMKTKTITNTNKKLTEPFTILLMGVDSATDGLNANAAFNGDTLMLITFNPNTLTATMFSIPRDTYVPIACNNNRSHKINSSAAYGTECVVNTVQNLVDINIDYYAKINFNGVIDLVNALGGIDVDVEEPDYNTYVKRYGQGRLCESNSFRDMNNLVCMNTGMQHLNGEQALAYARNRHGFLTSDLARNKHQQQIVEAIAKQVLKIRNFSDFEKLLEVVGKNIATNLSTTQMLSFYQTIKNMFVEGLKGKDFISIQKTYLEVYNLPIIASGLTLSALGYYDDSLKAIKEALEVNLGIKKEEMIKTFAYDYNEEYTSPIVGKGLTGGKLESTIPNLKGNTVSFAQEWAANNNINLNVEFTCSTDTPGLIGDQSVSAGISMKSISSLTIYVNEFCSDSTASNNSHTNTNNADDNTNNNNKEDEDEEIINTIPGSPSNKNDKEDE